MTTEQMHVLTMMETGGVSVSDLKPFMGLSVVEINNLLTRDEGLNERDFGLFVAAITACQNKKWIKYRLELERKTLEREVDKSIRYEVDGAMRVVKELNEGLGNIVRSNSVVLWLLFVFIFIILIFSVGLVVSVGQLL